jgi:hypothetical protein
MHTVEFTRLLVREVQHAERADFKAALLEVRDDLAGFAGRHRIRFYDGEGVIHSSSLL